VTMINPTLEFLSYTNITLRELADILDTSEPRAVLALTGMYTPTLATLMRCHKAAIQRPTFVQEDERYVSLRKASIAYIVRCEVEAGLRSACDAEAD